MTKYVMAYDCGTTSLKAALVQTGGAVVADANEPYALNQPRPGWAEQNPSELWDAICRASGRVLARAGVEDVGDVAACVFVAPWKNIIPMTADGDVLRESMIWLDSRAIDQAAALNERLGHFVGTGQEYWPRLMWLKENDPEVWRRADHIVGLNAYFKWRATGVFVTEPSDDFINSTNSEVQERFDAILAAAGLDEDRGKFPPSAPSTERVGELTRAAAGELGLAAGTPVFGGFGDLPAITAGVGRSQVDGVHIYFGTSSWFVCVTDNRDTLDPPLWFTFDAAHEGAMFPLQTGCLAYDWAVGQLYHAEKAERGEKINDFLNEEVAAVEPGSRNLIATHWLNGELPPLAKNAKGMFLNLTADHDRRHMVRAMMEGICYTHRMNVERFCGASGVELSSIRVVGGGATSDVWMQMLADILKLRVEVPQSPRYTGAMGAYFCAMIGLGEIEDYSAVGDAVPIGKVFTPQPDNAAVYDHLYDVYTQLYPTLRGLFDQLNGQY